MFRATTVLLTVLLTMHTVAEQRFIKTISHPGYGSAIRVLPTDDFGWVVFSLDSLKLSKFNSCGIQEWSKQINVANTHNTLNDFILTASGGFALLTRIQKGNVYGSLVTKLDAAGNITWSKSLSHFSYDHYPYSLMEDQQGNLVVYGNTSVVPNNGVVFNMINKIDINGNYLWTKFYDHGWVWGGAIVTSDNGVLARAGNHFIKTDNAGNLQWTSQVYSLSTYNYFAPIEVSDGYIFTTDNSSGTQFINIHKMDKQGNLLWGGRKTTDFIGTPPKLRLKSNGNIIGVFKKSGAGNACIVEFDKDLNIIHESSIDNGLSLTARDMCFLKDGLPILAGISSNQPFFAKFDNNYTSQCNVPIAPSTITLDGSGQNFITTNVSNHIWIASTENFVALSFPASQNVICPLPKYVNLGNDTVFCSNQTFTLKNYTADVFEHYLWSTGETTSTINIHQSGTYWLRAWDDCLENSVMDTVSIVLKEVEEFSLGTDRLLCEDSTILLAGPACDSCNYLWNTGDTSKTFEITSQGTYWLTLYNSKGCLSYDTIEVRSVKCFCDWFIPSAFSPNQDGVNESFFPLQYCDFIDYNMSIFNRWGQLVYSTTDVSAGWNGKFNNKTVQQGVYIYIYNYTPLLYGKLNDKVTKSGLVTVMY